MQTFLLIVAVLGDILLALALWAARSDLDATAIREWHVRRTLMHLRDGEPLVGEERHIARSLLGDKLVETIQREVRHD